MDGNPRDLPFGIRTGIALVIGIALILAMRWLLSR
jgi:hypothetical protein